MVIGVGAALLGSAVIGGLGSYFGQKSANEANKSIAATAGAKNMKMFREGNQFSAKQATLAYQRNVKQAKVNRNFQQTMADTSFQRGIADMRKSGLNPILAYAQGGAQSPGGNMATAPSASSSGYAGTPTATMHDELGAGISSAQGHIRLNQELKNMKATQALTKAQRAGVMETERFSRAQRRINADQALIKNVGDMQKIRKEAYEVGTAKQLMDQATIKTSLDRMTRDRFKSWGDSIGGRNADSLERYFNRLGQSLPRFNLPNPSSAVGGVAGAIDSDLNTANRGIWNWLLRLKGRMQ